MRIAFVDHSFHKITGSVDFLRNTLAIKAEVVPLWDESWEGKPGIGADDINKLAPDAAIFFQILPPHRELDRLFTTNITYVPMRDAQPLTNRLLRGLRERGIKLLAFCLEHYQQACSAGVDALYAQYYPKPSNIIRNSASNPLRIFFWQRHPFPDWNTVARLLARQTGYELVVKIDTDPGVAPTYPNDDDVRQHNIQIIEGWLPRERYDCVLNSCDVFVAPRLVEGIGQATLYAMSQAMAVVAADRPTANEYIAHGSNGLLYDPDHIAPLPAFDATALGRSAWESVRAGRLHWDKSIGELIDFVLHHRSAQRRLKIKIKSVFRRRFG